MIDKYFVLFPDGACEFADSGARVEMVRRVGHVPVPESAVRIRASPATTMRLLSMKPRQYVLHVETGIAVGFVRWVGAWTDFDMFKVRSGKSSPCMQAFPCTRCQMGIDVSSTPMRSA